MRISSVELVLVFPIDLRIKVIEAIKPSFAPSEVIIIVIIIIIIIIMQTASEEFLLVNPLRDQEQNYVKL